MAKRELQWHEVFELLNEKLRYFISNSERKNVDPGVALFHRAASDDAIKQLNKWFSSPSRFEPESLDPIHLFTSIASSGLKEPTRNSRVNQWLYLLTNEIEDIKADFAGCPQIPPVKVLSARSKDQQDQIWDLYRRAVNVGLDGINQHDFDNMKSWYGINISSLTIFLFWINSESFVPLDKNTVELFIRAGEIDDIPSSFESYKNLCENAKGKRDGIIRDVVARAYGSTKTGGSADFKNILSEFLEKAVEPTSGFANQNFKIVGVQLRPNEDGEKQEHAKNLNHNLLCFYEAYTISEGGDLIKFKADVEEFLYNLDNLSISISAVVGKNGSGKSTITELIFLAVNQLSRQLLKTDEAKGLLDEEVFLDLYVLSDGMYRVRINTRITLFQYGFNESNSEFHSPEEIQATDFLKSFCYTIVLNYSLYGLNSRFVGKWIYNLFYKNDAYQIPIAFNPRRDEGKIDINKEETLAHSRLLTVLLEPENNDFQERVVPPIVEEKVPNKILFELDSSKLQRYRGEKYNGPKGTDGVVEKALVEKWIERVFGILKLELAHEVYKADEVKEYLFYKLIGICFSYPQVYGNYINFKEENREKLFESFKKSDFQKFIAKLYRSSSHITFKTKQAIHYLHRGTTFSEVIKRGEAEVIALSEAIANHQKSLFSSPILGKKSIVAEELLPPSIFKTDIEFTNQSLFRNLSSGEKQNIFATNSVAYHLKNLDSVEETERIRKYSYANIIFDEVELYFHPDMQRTFLNDLLRRVEKLSLNHIRGLNILFVTHSPFILSDIPLRNILRMKNGAPFTNSATETFGANVHDLLANEFFMEKGFIGEFAREKINELIAYLKSSSSEEVDSIQRSGIHWDETNARAFISIIGEPLLKMKLSELYDTKFKNSLELELLRKRIEELKNGK